LCEKQTLNELIKRRKRITEVEAKYYLHQIISGVKDIHHANVIHRDLKLGNLFLAEGLKIKIGDFGLAAKLAFDSERRKTMCGTPNYIAPEILESKYSFIQTMDIHLKLIFGVSVLFLMLSFVEDLLLKLVMSKQLIKRSRPAAIVSLIL
jgi:serine/threonine protein kinase